MSGEYIAGRELEGPQEFSADTVVVGSGSSGAVVAAVLAAAGESVVVLEEGPRVREETYSGWRPSQSMKEIWREGGTTGALGLGNSPVINVTMGRCVGGSSVLTGGVCFRTPEYVLNEWVEDHGLKDLAPNLMEPHFEDVERVMHIQEVPEDMRSRSTELFIEGGTKLGWEFHSTKRNTDGCKGHGVCNFGCPIGAKMSVDVTYLKQAVADGTVVVSDCLVERVFFKDGRAAGVEGRLLDANRKPGASVKVVAKRVVLACGAAHTPLVLWNSGVNLREIGRNLTLHPSFRMLARFDEKVRGWQGALQSAYSTSLEEQGVTLMSVFVPPFAVAGGVPGFGKEFIDRVGGLDHLAMFGGLIHDEGGGRIRKPPLGLAREPLMTYRMTREDFQKIPLVIQSLGNAFLKAGAKELYVPILGHEPVQPDEFAKLDFGSIKGAQYECSSQHPLGTTRMGIRSSDSVVNSRGRVWCTEGLYVVDGGILPTSLGVNPQVSILAMAHRLASMMV